MHLFLEIRPFFQPFLVRLDKMQFLILKLAKAAEKTMFFCGFKKCIFYRETAPPADVCGGSVCAGGVDDSGGRASGGVCSVPSAGGTSSGSE